MITPVLLDVESRSRANLKRVDGRLYWQHPSSAVLVVVWYDTANGAVGAWYPGDVWPHHGRVLAAHNAHGFDRFALERYGITAAEWIDTAQLARKAGLPGALDALGVRWCGTPKDKVASAYTRSLSAVARPVARIDALAIACPRCAAAVGDACRGVKHAHKARRDAAPSVGREIPATVWRDMPDDERRRVGTQPAIDAAVMSRVVAYCASDVAIMVDAWPRLAEWIPVDAEVEALDRVLNDRGVAFDSALARRLLAEDARICDAVIAEVARACGVTVAAVREAASSPAQFCAATGAADAQAATVETMAHPLARARMALASITRGKMLAGLARVGADGRMRDTMRYYGGHTGRWSSVGMQLHNLPRPDKRFEDVRGDARYPALDDGAIDVDAFADAVLTGRECDAAERDLLVRATITASRGHRLAVADFASVEARGTAWAADDRDAIAVFTSDLDPYRVAAAAIYGIDYAAVTWQRKVGKVAELACGYGGGPAAFEKFAAVYRVDLSALDLRATVTAWRTLHRPIVALWYACERAFRSAIEGRARTVGPFEFVPSDAGDAVACFLPSGRPIVYHAARISRDGSLAYLGVHGTEHVYGGKLIENAIQALCRDLMAVALLRAEREGLNPVLTVHDEIVCDVPEARADGAYAALRDAMLALPAWAAGFPIGCSGWIGRRYRK